MSTLMFDQISWKSAPEPVCQVCGCRTRLTGVEPHPRLRATDVRTFQCLACNETQSIAVPLA